MKMFFLILSLMPIHQFARADLPKRQAKEPNFYYDPEIVSLEGKLSYDTFPGPPEYDNVKKGDKPESFWILNLDHPISVSRKGEVNPDELDTPEANIRRLQIVFDYDKFFPESFHFKVGQRFRVKGTLYHRHTIHHRTEVLLTINGAERVQ